MPEVRPKRPRKIAFAIIAIVFGCVLWLVRDPIAWAAATVVTGAGLWELVRPNRACPRCGGRLRVRGAVRYDGTRGGLMVYAQCRDCQARLRQDAVRGAAWVDATEDDWQRVVK